MGGGLGRRAFVSHEEEDSSDSYSGGTPYSNLDTNVGTTLPPTILSEGPGSDASRVEWIQFRSTLSRVTDILQNKGQTSLKLDNWKDRDKLISITGPKFKVLHWRKLEELGQLPSYDLNQSVSLSDASKFCDRQNTRMNIIFFSHQWSKFGGGGIFPDDEIGTKARALVILAKHNFHFYSKETFYFIDYSCIDNCEYSKFVAMMPLYMMACDGGILCYDNEGFDDTAWTRLECALWASANSPQQWRYLPSLNRGRDAFWSVLEDPRLGELNDENHMHYIRDLAEVTLNLWGKFWHFANDYESWGVNTQFLTFGVTAVSTRAMDQFPEGWNI